MCVCAALGDTHLFCGQTAGVQAAPSWRSDIPRRATSIISVLSQSTHKCTSCLSSTQINSCQTQTATPSQHAGMFTFDYCWVLVFFVHLYVLGKQMKANCTLSLGHTCLSCNFNSLLWNMKQENVVWDGRVGNTVKRNLKFIWTSWQL